MVVCAGVCAFESEFEIESCFAGEMYKENPEPVVEWCEVICHRHCSKRRSVADGKNRLIYGSGPENVDPRALPIMPRLQTQRNARALSDVPSEEMREQGKNERVYVVGTA